MDKNKTGFSEILIPLILVATVIFYILIVYIYRNLIPVQSDNAIYPEESSTPIQTPSPTKEASTPSPTSTNTPVSSTDKTHRILTIGFNTVENGESYADRYFASAMRDTAKNTEQRIWQNTKNALERVTGDSFKFEIVKSINITDQYIYNDGFSYDINSYNKCVWGNKDFDNAFCEQRKFEFDYIKWVESNKICELADQVNADEIWMLSLPFIMTWENFMIGPTPGFNVNGRSYKVDSCNKHYIVVAGTYDRTENMLHNIGHRVESTMGYLMQNWNENDKEKYWNQFTNMERYSGKDHKNISCGNTHFPHNASAAYDYTNLNEKISNCSDWANFPNFEGDSELIDCKVWGCEDAGWQEYWLSNIPNRSGSTKLVTNSGKEFLFPNNWWPLLLSPDLAIAKKSEM